VVRGGSPTGPPVLFLSECHSCASLSTPYKETTPNPPYPISPPPLLSFLPSPHKNICPPPDCYCRCLLSLSACLRSPPRLLRLGFSTPPRRRPIRGRCRPQPWRCRPRPRLTQVRTRARSGQLRRPAFFSLRSCSPSPPRGDSFLMTPASVPAGDPLYPELWRACAGPLVTVPRVGDLVFYFPQGHIEQVRLPLRLPLCSRWSLGLLPLLRTLTWSALRWRRP
jgi:hypothetical protein